MTNNSYQSRKDLETILPHKQPMILLDKIIDYDIEELWLKAEVTINKQSQFFDQSYLGVPMWVGIEYMAQSIAALASLKDLHISQKNKQANYTPKIGFIMGCRNYSSSEAFFQEGENYSIFAKELFIDHETGAFTGTISHRKNQQLLEIAKAQINVYQPDSTEAFFSSQNV